MHYVLKNKIAGRLIASARDVKNEFLRLQSRLLSIDQNNIGLGAGAYLPGEEGEVDTGISTYAFVEPATDSVNDLSSKALTAVHRSDFDPAFGGVNVFELEKWVDQTSIAAADKTFRVFRPAPYLITGQMTLKATVVGGPGSPTFSVSKDGSLRALLSIRLDGEVLEPAYSQSYSCTEMATLFIGAPAIPGAGYNGGETHMPLFFATTRVLQPGEHRATLSVKVLSGPMPAGASIEVLYPQAFAIGFIR